MTTHGAYIIASGTLPPACAIPAHAGAIFEPLAPALGPQGPSGREVEKCDCDAGPASEGTPDPPYSVRLADAWLAPSGKPEARELLVSGRAVGMRQGENHRSRTCP